MDAVSEAPGGAGFGPRELFAGGDGVRLRDGRDGGRVQDQLQGGDAADRGGHGGRVRGGRAADGVSARRGSSECARASSGR